MADKEKYMEELHRDMEREAKASRTAQNMMYMCIGAGVALAAVCIGQGNWIQALASAFAAGIAALVFSAEV